MDITTSLVDWSRAQFALTAMYHWLFVPLTLGLSIIMSIMETIYYKTGNELWKRITKFWMTLFGVNFAIGVATGIILEFEFGTNWSNYSWFVGDIFGAPLAIEGMMAFFLEAIFSAVMFFGWNKVSKGFHLTATWMTTIGASISALWILVANAWMQYPVGMKFNPETVRNEMVNFFDIVLSPVAIDKFFHTTISSWTLGAAFVIGVSCWFLIKNRNIELAKKSIKIASAVGVFAILITIFTGDRSAKTVARVQPMKLAAMEGLYHGNTDQSIVAFGILNPKKRFDNDEKTFLYAFRIPYVLSYLAYGNIHAYVAGINDILNGGYTATGPHGDYIMQPIEERIESGKTALNALSQFREAKKNNNIEAMAVSEKTLSENYNNFGYGYVKEVEQVIPDVHIVFYSFHIMVILGFYFLILFFVFLFTMGRNNYDGKKYRWLMWVGLWSIPLAYIMSESGWVTAEVGRQPWTIQDILPTFASVSRLSSDNVQTTFWMFLILFTALLIADILIIVRQIKKEDFSDMKDNSGHDSY